MKIALSLCCMMLAMLLHPGVLKNESGSAFRMINIYQRGSYNYFDSMAITSSQDFNAFIEEISQQLYWNNQQRQEFVNALVAAKVDFNQEALVLLRHDEGSGSVRVTLEPPTLQDKTLLCEIRGEILGMGTGDMAYHCFALAVSKSLVNKVQLNAVSGLGPRPRSPIFLSTTEREPLKIRRDPTPELPSPSDCPKLILECPTDLLETGKTYKVKLLVEGGNPKYDLTYGWSVQGGEIVEGQGTHSLKVRINQSNEILKAFVELGGFNPYCDRLATCSCGPSK